MKKILLAGLVICGLSAHAGMGSGDNFISFQAGLSNFSHIGLEDSRFVLSYGMDIESNRDYVGFAEVGIKAPVALLSLKYGYEFMRQDTFSFGVDIAVLFGIPGYSFQRGVAMSDLALGNEVGAFVKMEATDNISGFIRGGIWHETSFRNLSNLNSNSVRSFADIGVQYNL